MYLLFLAVLNCFVRNLQSSGYKCVSSSGVFLEYKDTCFVINDLWRPSDVMTPRHARKVVSQEEQSDSVEMVYILVRDVFNYV